MLETSNSSKTIPFSHIDEWTFHAAQKPFKEFVKI